MESEKVANGKQQIGVNAGKLFFWLILQQEPISIQLTVKKVISKNRLFHSCVLGYLAYDCKEARVDPYFDTKPLCFSHANAN